jgi:lipoate-protein ligase A
VERDVGGRAVAYTGSTIAFARFLPLEDPRRGLEDRYRALMDDVQVALERVGVDARPGEPPDSFCAGDYSLQADGKVVGIAQRVTADAAVVSGIMVVDQHEAIAEVLADVYTALSVSFDPDSVGSVARAGGAVDRIRAELEDVLVGEEPVEIERLRSR